MTQPKRAAAALLLLLTLAGCGAGGRESAATVCTRYSQALARLPAPSTPQRLSTLLQAQRGLRSQELAQLRAAAPDSGTYARLLGDLTAEYSALDAALAAEQRGDDVTSYGKAAIARRLAARVAADAGALHLDACATSPYATVQFPA